MTVNRWIDPPSPSDAPRMILDEPDAKAFWPKGKESDLRNENGAFRSIADVRAYAEGSGWIDGSGTDLLYVSSGSDLRPLFALSPERLEEKGVDGTEAPVFFVHTDHTFARSDDEILESFDHEGVSIEPEEIEVTHLGNLSAHLLFLTVREGNRSRRVVLFRLVSHNALTLRGAQQENWRPRWFVGICDGCNGFGRQDRAAPTEADLGTVFRCENQVAESFESIPLSLGCRFWLTDHLCLGTKELKPFETELLQPGEVHSLPTGEELRLIHYWLDWPDGGTDLGKPSLYEVLSQGSSQ